MPRDTMPPPSTVSHSAAIARSEASRIPSPGLPSMVRRTDRPHPTANGSPYDTMPIFQSACFRNSHTGNVSDT